MFRSLVDHLTTVIPGDWNNHGWFRALYLDAQGNYWEVLYDDSDKDASDGDYRAPYLLTIGPSPR